jgi:ABC-type polysaccharide/polyol phosphate transport system ATPase subunit
MSAVRPPRGPTWRRGPDHLQPARARTPRCPLTDAVVSVRDLSKRFKLYKNPWGRVLEWITWGRAVRHESFWALQGINLEVKRGECVGIIGVNGAGKTTLLKILSRALYPTTGSFEVKGRLVSLLELGTGFHPELTGRQNIFQSARLLGFPEAFVRAQLPAILDLAQIGEFVDQPVKQYSSGMFVRLAFSLFAHLEPDVYIVDEALSVGDIFFQQKCFERFRELRARGCTILLVSHEMEAITHLCDRAILLNGGKIASEGEAASVVHDYFALMGQTMARGESARSDGPRKAVGQTGERLDRVPAGVRHQLEAPPPGTHAPIGSRATEIVGFAVSDPDGNCTWAIDSGGTLTFWYLIAARDPADNWNLGIHLYDRRGILVFAVGAANRGLALPRLEPGDRLACAISVTLAVQPGEYTILPQTGGLTGGSPEPGLLHDRLESLPPVVVTRREFGGVTPFYGLVELPASFAWVQEG